MCLFVGGLILFASLPHCVSIGVVSNKKKQRDICRNMMPIQNVILKLNQQF
jgi:hypothetical protein